MEFARRTWKCLVYNVTDLWVALAALIALVVGVSLVASLAITVIGGLAALVATLVACRWMAEWERHRLNTLLGTDLSRLTPVGPPANEGRLARLTRHIDAVGWRAFGYWWLKQVTAPIGFALTVAVWSGGLALVAMPAYRRHLPGDTARLLITDVDSGRAQGWAVAAGAGLLFVAPFVTLAVGRGHAALANALLRPGRVTDLRRQLGVATERRDLAVEAADAERRRIERDLHDGAQQRLVALAMSLGMAKEKFADEPDAARALLDEAHGEAKAAMVELRNIARGIHPAVLADRGLDAALSGLVARAPIPVALTVGLGSGVGLGPGVGLGSGVGLGAGDIDGGRLPAAVEGAAYYVVAEALTNLAKHAEATRASVTLARQGERLVIAVTDDGRGGAVIRPGGGLAGLDERVRSLGGFVHLSSPVGGPTNLLVELSCAS